jgi:hypothetical protein
MCVVPRYSTQPSLTKRMAQFLCVAQNILCVYRAKKGIPVLKNSGTTGYPVIIIIIIIIVVVVIIIIIIIII